MDRYAYNVPDEFRPKRWPDLMKVASRPYMGLTAYIAGRAHLVIAFDGQDYTLEDAEGETIQLASFLWDDENLSEENALVAASRIEGSPFEVGMEIDGQVIGKLSFDDETGEWSVEDTNGESVSLLNLIEQLEAQGWSVEEEVEPEADGPVLDADKAAAADCDKCEDGEDCEPNCDCFCHNADEPNDTNETLDAISTEKEAVADEGDIEKDKPVRCPKCKSHTHKPLHLNKDGDSEFSCANCGETYKHKVRVMGSFDKTTDTNGDLLREGIYYEMHSPKYRIADTIRVIQITPDFLVATTHEGSVTLTLKAADLDSEGYSFEPLMVEGADHTIESHFHVTARRKYSPTEQSAFIEEDGQARNADKLNLDGTHYGQIEASGDESDLYFLW